MTRSRLTWLTPLVAAFGLFLQTAPARASSFDVFPETWNPAPPYPTATPVRADVYDLVGGAMTQLQLTKQGLLDASTAGVTCTTRCAGSDNGGGYGAAGVNSFFDVFFEPSVAAPTLQVSSFFDIFTEVALAGTGLRGPLIVLNDTYPTTDARRWFTSGWVRDFAVFSLQCEVGLPARPQWRLHYRWDIEVVAAGGHFASVPTIHFDPTAAAYFDVATALTLPGPVTTETKLYTVTASATLLTDPVATEAGTWSSVKQLYR